LITKTIIFLLILACSNTLAFSFQNLEFKRNENKYFITLSPVALAGTHVDGIGINSQAGLRLNHITTDKTVSSCVSLHCYPNAYMKYYGIPGNSVQLNTGASLSLTLGRRIDLVNNPWVQTELGKHTFKYFFSYYLSSDSTSQPYAGVEYKLTLKKLIFRIRLDQDDCYFLATDKYRSTMGDIEFLRYNLENAYGMNVGFHLWTGNLDGTATHNAPDLRDNTYALTGYGGDYSHGILSLTLIYNFLRLSVGYDSEEIRNTIQNGWHHFYNRPRVPLVNRSDRFYFQISLFNSELQY
jgi:hypothetical protein